MRPSCLYLKPYIAYKYGSVTQMTHGIAVVIVVVVWFFLGIALSRSLVLPLGR